MTFSEVSVPPFCNFCSAPHYAMFVKLVIIKKFVSFRLYVTGYYEFELNRQCKGMITWIQLSNLSFLDEVPVFFLYSLFHPGGV